ncbi:Protein arginine N-methyltransferase 7 [Taenia crassiceps]|uniref:Protein arginine N-methyltransferase n=1 Tax=Taenia crassiceps TaxID=6207 RepID=A0ABR4QD55_9CEST
MAACMKSPSSHTLCTFTSCFNPTTGIAQSAYADMLHDRDRNQRYYEALRHVITEMKAAGREVHVLDIGSGTGLLSMMAARAGADSVVACEAFEPVASCAIRILEANGLAGRVKLVHKHSTDLVVGEDMPRKANVLVAELFDTELIGEGALNVYLHAIDNLLTSDAILIPCKAKMYLQIVESPFLWSHNQIETFGGDLSFPPEEMRRCHGSPAVFDLQISRLKFVNDEIITQDGDLGAIRCLLGSPLMFHEFNFAPHSSNLKLVEAKRITEVDGKPITVYRGGLAHAIIVWWELQMEPSGHVPAITTAPSGAGPFAGPDDPLATPAWREHWMQAVYFPHRCPLSLSTGEALCIDFSHDAFSIHLNFHRASSSPPLANHRMPSCHCLTHVAWPRSRFAQLNNSHFRQDCLRLTQFVVDHSTTFFLLRRLSRHPCRLIAPTHLRICAVAMEFENLWKIRAPVGADCEGFDLRLFDKMVLAAAAVTDAPVEPQPLWQYAGKARSLPSSVFEMSLIDPPTFSAHGPAAPKSLDAQVVQIQTLPLSTVTVTAELSVNAVALWAEWRMADEIWHVVGGPSRPIEVDKEVEWCRSGPYPGVAFLSGKLRSQRQPHALKVESYFDFYTGEPNFCFSVV